MPPKDPKERKDWCGHVTMTYAENEFFKEFQRKALMTETLRSAGLLEQRPSRNPLRAEKTPRQPWQEPGGQRFDFAIPPVNEAEVAQAARFASQGKPNKEWEYPENDWGLMSKFKTQKESYDKVKAMKSNYEGRVEIFKNTQKANEQSIIINNNNGSSSSSSSNINNNNSDVPLSGRVSARFNSSRSDLGGYNDEYGGAGAGAGTGGQNYTSRMTGRAGLNSIRESLEAADESLRMALSKPSLGHFSVKTLKVLADSNPEILDKARAERAARYVSGLKFDPTEPPKLTTDYNATQSARDRLRPVFRPGGGAVEMDESKRKKNSDVESKEDKDPMAKLMAQLKETNAAIDSQKSKLGIKK